MQRAVDFIEVNLDGPIVLADIVAASGIPGRTLAQHFHRFRGTTPMRYLRRAQLATSIALSSGFAYMSRFAAEYRKTYGEMPSQTLRKRWPA